MGKDKLWPKTPNLNGVITLWTTTTKKLGSIRPGVFFSPYKWNIHLACSKFTTLFWFFNSPTASTLDRFLRLIRQTTRFCAKSAFLVRSKTIVFGRTCFTRDVFFLQREISEMRGPTGAKFCTMVSTRRYFIMPSKIWGAHPKKNLGAKNMQNLARFRTTWKFGSEYLWNEWRY